MEHEKLSELLGTLSNHKGARTADCLDDHDLAAVVDGGLSGEYNNRFIEHLAECDYCMAQVGLLKRLHATAAEQPVTEFTLARAKRAGLRNKHPVFRQVSRWAAAAVVVLAVITVIKWQSPVPEDMLPVNENSSNPGPLVLDARQSRNLNTDVLKPKVLAPVNGAAIEPGSLVFQWTGVPESLHYDVRVVTEGGDLVWQTRVSDTELTLPAHLQLEQGSEYFFRVDAYLATARSLQSEHVLFTVGGNH